MHPASCRRTLARCRGHELHNQGMGAWNSGQFEPCLERTVPQVRPQRVLAGSARTRAAPRHQRPLLEARACLLLAAAAAPCPIRAQGADVVVVEFALNDATFRVPEVSMGSDCCS